MAFGVLNGFLNNKPLFRSAFTAGTNSGVIGLTFLCMYEIFFLSTSRNNEPEISRDREELISSALSGGVTGGLWSALVGGRRTVVPGIIAFTLLCGTGQYFYTGLHNYRQRVILENEKVDKTRGGILDWLATKSWSPVRKISEEEYFKLKKDKLKERGIDTSLENDDSLNDSNKTK
ncbi:16639_t:CDS:2 [Acaulospora colombiana]|uniref:16639_t:CDS:1 n=1 Tax=Acaulospora colombiana TaxID=27376 RepID=A0ACA9JXX3_9GLOM|nr:16639_t:CDS:2 [Acaulospora colombiana]